MSKLIFTAEMFDKLICGWTYKRRLAQIVQAIHDKYMASGTVVYTSVVSDNHGWYVEDPQRIGAYKYTAILCDIKEIEKAEPCEHNILKTPGHTHYDRKRYSWECADCGKKLKPTGWKLADVNFETAKSAIEQDDKAGGG